MAMIFPDETKHKTQNTTKPKTKQNNHPGLNQTNETQQHAYAA
jgi:hypothetical protein